MVQGRVCLSREEETKKGRRGPFRGTGRREGGREGGKEEGKGEERRDFRERERETLLNLSGISAGGWRLHQSPTVARSKVKEPH